MPDKIHITVLPDGTIKTETDAISLANHGSAEQFLREVQQLAGGETEIRSKHGFVFTEDFQRHEQSEHSHH